MEKIKVEMIIEKGSPDLWARLTYNDNLITESGKNMPELEAKMKVLLHEFEGVDPETIEFRHQYDVYALFQEFDFLNISKIAQRAGIHAGLLRQYASGVKHPSLTRAKEIEKTIHELADKMSRSLVYAE